MSELIAGGEINITLDLLSENDDRLGFTVFHDYGASYISLEEFIEEAKKGLEPVDRQRYAGAFEIMARQLRG